MQSGTLKSSLPELPESAEAGLTDRPSGPSPPPERPLAVRPV
jgi:hypothetical protein